jgi:hypothetical protein
MKKFFLRIKTLFAILMGDANKFEKFLIEHVDVAIDVVNKIKKITDSSLLKSLIELLPEKYGVPAGAILFRISKAIDKVLEELGLAEVCFAKPTTVERLQCFIDHLNSLKKPHRDALKLKFAALLVKHSSETDLQQAVIDGIVQNRLLERKFNIIYY